MSNRALSKLHGDKRGAVLVEFLVAVMPLMITFSSFVQVSQIARARLVVKHSAIIGARAASVISNEHKNTPDQNPGKNEDVINQSVRAAIGPWNSTMTVVSAKVTDNSSCDDQYGLVSVEVTAVYKCTVPFGARLVCGLGGMHPFKQKYSMPHQGARYKDDKGGGC